MQITFLTWASAPSGKPPGRPSFCCRFAFSPSLRTSKPTPTVSTPSRARTFWATACSKWARIGQPAVVRETTTSTRVPSISIERTMPRSTMFWRSSGSMTARSASVTCSSVGEEDICLLSQTATRRSARVGLGSIGERLVALRAVLALADLLDHLRAECLEIAGVSRGDETLIDDDLLVDPVGAGVAKVGLQARPRR